jgi:hypothetical protein
MEPTWQAHLWIARGTPRCFTISCELFDPVIEDTGAFASEMFAYVAPPDPLAVVNLQRDRLILLSRETGNNSAKSATATDSKL